ncbi:MAG: hypothetical protein ACI906_004820 [Candidatus Latescibacterota bacterium]|jgi:hypothetical protein
MQRTEIESPTSRVRFAMSRVDITPPVGIYHRMWGAARHDQATGVHRPLQGDVLVFEPFDEGGSKERMIRVQLDHVGFVTEQHDALRAAIAESAGLALEQVVLTYSHTHSGGWYIPDRFALPGGDLIPPYLVELATKLQQACREAMGQVREATISYATGRCDMAANRDCWDSELNAYVTGYNPDADIDNEVVVGRVTDADGILRHIFVQYACHPTTLAWENSLLSPDFVGAMREEVECQSGVLCTYLQGPCGDIGPKNGHQGDPAVADSNGQQLAFSALSILASIGPPAHDFQYRGPVVSGATLGTWAYRPCGDGRLEKSARFSGGTYAVDLPLKEKPDQEGLEREFEDWNAQQEEADRRGDTVAARDYGARAERARRWIARLVGLPDADSFSMAFTVYRLGDAIWVTCGGEPYNVLQSALRRRFPQWTILVSPIDSGIQIAYLLPAESYGKGLYQEEPSMLAQGCLEHLLEAIALRIEQII